MTTFHCAGCISTKDSRPLAPTFRPASPNLPAASIFEACPHLPIFASEPGPALWPAGRPIGSPRVWANCGIEVELVPITTQGDVKTQPLGQIGGQGLFTKELQRALLDSQIDLAVHSLKDLPTAPVEGLVLAAVPERESTADVLVSSMAQRIEDLPTAARIGTGSLRRKAQLLHVRPDLRIEDIRGNVETRLRKLDEGQFDAIVLAEAGLKRLGLSERIAHVIPRSSCCPRSARGRWASRPGPMIARHVQLLAPLDHAATHQAVIAERSLLLELRGGCLAPVGAYGRVEAGACCSMRSS